ncbi:MAG TPA: EAL domain-containing protein [Terriglobales bacterium]|nr:EAL domain-containing protein [Terriglobales bacterium]
MTSTSAGLPSEHHRVSRTSPSWKRAVTKVDPIPRCALWLFPVIWAFAALVCAAERAPHPLATVGDVAQRELDSSPYGIPVALNAQVTYVDAEWQILFVRDKTGSIFVQLPPKASGIDAGDIVHLSGLTAPGEIGSNIVHPRVQVAGRRPLPVPRKMSAAAIQAGMADSEYVVTEGVIRPGPSIWDHTSLTLADGATSIPLIIPGGVNPAAQGLIGARALVRGVTAVRLDDAKHPIGYQLFVQNLANVEPEEADWKPSFQAAVLPISRVSDCTVTDRFIPAYHVRGKVLWNGAGALIIADDSGSIEVQGIGESPARPGALVDVLGFPSVIGHTTVLKDALARVLAATPPPATVFRRVSAAEALRSGRDGDTVQISGRVVDQSGRATDHEVLVDDAGQRFEVLISSASPSAGFVRLTPGAALDVWGRFRRVHQRDHRPDTIQILLDSPSQILIRGAQPNWRAVAGFAAGIFVLGVLIWNLQLRRALRSKMVLLRRQVEHEALLESRCRRLVERNLAAVFSWRPSGEITHCNQAFASMLGYGAPEQVIGKSYWGLLTGESRLVLTNCLETGAANGIESSLVRADGTVLALLENVTRVHDEGDIYFETTGVDITQSKLDRIELQRARDAAQHQADIDALTKLPNRRRFAQIANELVTTSGAGQSIALLYLDLDGFKEVNDTCGHVTGDLLLEQVASRLRSVLSTEDELYRLGGDEFAALLTQAASVAESGRVAAALLSSLDSPFRVGNQELRISGSIGISCFPTPAPDHTSLLQQADSAMYVAKRSGRNRVSFYSEEIGDEIRERNSILAELRGAVERNEICLHYQPEFSRSAHQIVRFEALARWQNRVLGAVSPGKFVPVAEEGGLMLELGTHILELACREACKWMRETGQMIPVAVNVSAAQLRASSFAEDVLAILNRTGIPPGMLELEMTESIMQQDVQKCREVLSQLRGAGISLALDDFGTGYSSLSYLPDLPFERLKIARSFLEKLHRGRGGEALIHAVISIAHNLGITVVVEGIETERELVFVQRAGADELQGYYLGSPSPDPMSLIEAAVANLQFQTGALADARGFLQQMSLKQS